MVFVNTTEEIGVADESGGGCEDVGVADESGGGCEVGVADESGGGCEDVGVVDESGGGCEKAGVADESGGGCADVGVTDVGVTDVGVTDVGVTDVGCNIRLVEVCEDKYVDCFEKNCQDEPNANESTISEPAGTLKAKNRDKGSSCSTELERETETKQGRKLCLILGMTEEVFQFDKARKRLRASPNNITLINLYSDILTVMESKIAQEQTKFKQQLKQIEHQHYKNTGKLLTSKQLLKHPASKMLMDKMKYCKALVDQWKIEKK